MSQLRQQAEQVISEGAMQRRNWNPDLDTFHYKIYKYWRTRSKRYIPRENFCHYWRVVAIWGPLRFMVKPLLALLGVAVLGGIIAVLAIFPKDALQFVAITAGFIYIGGGILIYLQILQEIVLDNGTPWEWFDDRSTTVKALAVLVTLPVFVGALAVTAVVASIGTVLIGLGDDYDFYRRFGRWSITAKPGESKWLSWIRPVLSVPLALVVLSIWYVLPRVFLATAALFALVMGLSVLAAWYVETSRTRRKEQYRIAQKEARRAQNAFMLRLKFALTHPERAADEEKYQQWLKRFTSYSKSRYGQDPLTMEEYQLWRYDAHKLIAWRDAGAAVASAVSTKSRSPRRFSTFARNVGDFFVLIWSVVLTKKWKICPLVALPE